MRLKIDLDEIHQISKKKEKENIRFRIFLKRLEDIKIDKAVRRINKEVTEQIDCTLCGNCCKNLKPGVNTMEIDALAAIEKISCKEFEIKYTKWDDLENGVYLKDVPCKYLSDKKCSIYDFRPYDCKSFPHIHKSRFNSRTMSVMESYRICPIIFNVVERLKIEFRFR